MQLLVLSGNKKPDNKQRWQDWRRLKRITNEKRTCQPCDSPAWRVPESHKEARAWQPKPSDLKIYKPPETSSKRL